MNEKVKRIGAIVLCIGIFIFCFSFGLFMGMGGKDLPGWLLPLLIFGAVCFVTGGGFTWYRMRLEKQAELDKLREEAASEKEEEEN